MATLLRVPPMSAARMRGTVDRQIQRVGMLAVLRRAAGDRKCWMFFSAWTARELMGGLVDPLDRAVVISPLDLAIPPTLGEDRLITFVQPVDWSQPVEDENLRILAPPERIAPAGILVCWKLRVRR